jgi:anti-anti-sigma factor
MRNDGNVTVVDFGKCPILDIVTADRMGKDLYRLADDPGCPNLLLNFSGVTGVSSVMVGKLLVLRKKMQCKRGRLKLCGVGAELREAFTIMKLTLLLDIQVTEADALRSFA